MYFVGMWVVFQVVDFISTRTGLPTWTLNLVIVGSLLGLPIALVLSWLFDITPGGIVTDDGSGAALLPREQARGRFECLIDVSLIAVAAIICGQLAIAELSPVAGLAREPVRKISVDPFRAAGDGAASALVQSLVSDLQHEIAHSTRLKVVVPGDTGLPPDCATLAGSIAVVSGRAKVTVTLIDNSSDEVTWTRVFHYTDIDSLAISTEISREIVAALPVGMSAATAEGVRHET